MNSPNVDDRLMRIGPTGSPDPDALADAYARLSAHLELPDAVAGGPRRAPARQLRQRRARRVSLTILVGAAAAFAIVAIPVLSIGGRPPTSAASAAEVLVRAGKAAGEQPDVSRDAPYWHTAVVYADVESGFESARREKWAGQREWSVIIDTTTGPEPWLTDHATFGPRLAWDEVFALPTDPSALEDALRRSIHPDDPGAVTDTTIWGSVFDLIANSPAPPALRQALWEVAAQNPDMTVGGDVSDSTGRPGVLVTRDQEQLIVDPETGRLLEQVWSHGPDVPPYRRTFLEQGPADTAPYAPYPDLPPGCALDMHCDGGNAVVPSGAS